MIEKQINYLWLSKSRMPSMTKKCIESWKKHLDGYKIKCWTLNDFPSVTSDYVREAVNAKKWAFASDYLRMYILYTEGGIYMDSDIYLYRNFDNCLNNRFFSCIEFHHDSRNSAIQAACMGSEPEHPFVKKCLDYYDRRHFINADGSADCSVLAPDVYSECASSFGFDKSDIGEQELREGIRIYGLDLIAGTPWERLPGNIGVHMCAGSWRGYSVAQQQKWSKIKLKLVEK